MMVTKKRLMGSGVDVGVTLLIRVGHLFKYEVIQVTVKDKSPNGDYVKIGDGIEWFAIKSLKILDILKV